jgi:hypothetical protein
MELYHKLYATGAAIGTRTYIYKVLADLETEGRVRKDPKDRKYRVSPSASDREWEQPQVTQ